MRSLVLPAALVVAALTLSSMQAQAQDGILLRNTDPMSQLQLADPRIPPTSSRGFVNGLSALYNGSLLIMLEAARKVKVRYSQKKRVGEYGVSGIQKRRIKMRS